MEEEEQVYLKAFNNGYLLAQHEPELASKLTAQTNDQNDYFKGLVSGKKEYEAEVKEWVKGFTKGRGSKEDRGLSKDL